MVKIPTNKKTRMNIGDLWFFFVCVFLGCIYLVFVFFKYIFSMFFCVCVFLCAFFWLGFFNVLFYFFLVPRQWPSGSLSPAGTCSLPSPPIIHPHPLFWAGGPNWGNNMFVIMAINNQKSCLHTWWESLPFCLLQNLTLKCWLHICFSLLLTIH